MKTQSKKENEIYINFFKSNHTTLLKKNNKKINIIQQSKVVLSAFIVSQGLFTVANMYFLGNIANNFIAKEKETQQLVNKLKEDLSVGNQTKIITHFSALINKEDSISDIHVASIMNNIITQNQAPKIWNIDKTIPKYYVTEETQRLLLDMYHEKWNAGSKNTYKIINEYQCIPFDLSCFAIKSKFKKGIEKNYIENMPEINKTHYNLTYLSAYTQQLHEKIGNSISK